MIFIRYESFRKYLRFYPVTSIILFINIVMFLLMTFDGGSTNGNTLLQYGALYSPLNEHWRYLTSIFLHSGFDHLLFNCFALFVFAPPLERLFGHWRYAAFYVITGVLANLFSVAVSSEPVLSVGASGAIYGLYGAYLFIALFQRNMLDPSSRQTIYTLLVIGVVYSVIAPNINLMAHLGGLVAGFLLYALKHKMKL